jgi:peroxiredoxin
MQKQFLILFVLVFLFGKAKSQGYSIEVEWLGLKDTTIYLAHYYDTKIFVNDTLRLNKNGIGTFKKNESLKQGLYLLYLNESIYVDFLIGSQQTLKMKLDNSDLANSLKVSGASDSERFRNYQQFLKQQLEKQRLLNEQIKNTAENEKEPLQNQLNQLDRDFDNFFKKEMELDPKSMYHVFLKAVERFDIPEPPFDKTTASYDSLAWFYTYNYRRDHFFDGIDFSDDRILNTPLIKPKLDNYFNKILIQAPDSIIPQALKYLRISEKTPSMYQYLSQFLINNSAQSKIMGMDAVFVAVAEEVYLSGKASWTDSATYAKIREEVFLTKPNLIGKKAPEMFIESITGEQVSLHQSQARYTVLLFWEPNCGHCKKEVPAVYNEVFEPFMKYDVQVFAVCIGDNKEEWTQFVDEHELVGWIHAWDPSNKSGFRYKYNVKSSPMLYLLDQDKKIIAKRIDYSSLSKYLDSLIKN